MCYYSVYLIEEKRQLYSDVDSIASRGGRREKVKIERKEKGGGGETPNSIQLGCVCVRHIYIYMSKSAFGSLEKLWSVVDVVTPLTSAKRRSRLYSLSLSLLIPPPSVFLSHTFLLVHRVLFTVVHLCLLIKTRWLLIHI
jgi:hypothetical protein